MQLNFDGLGSWRKIFEIFFQSARGVELREFLNARKRSGAIIYPSDPFLALRLTSLESVCVVILGQDPYHSPGRAEGLAFSVPTGITIPPSLRNIFKEMHRDLSLPIPLNGTLMPWARRGVLLLNTSLTVEKGKPASHACSGWSDFTNSLIEFISAYMQRCNKLCAWLLWGAHAQSKQGLIEKQSAHFNDNALILRANHPSPLSAMKPPLPFIGCGHFSKVQHWFYKHGKIFDWSLEAGN